MILNVTKTEVMFFKTKYKILDEKIKHLFYLNLQKYPAFRIDENLDWKDHFMKWPINC